MNHVVNESRTPLEQVDAAFHTWRSHVDELTGIEGYYTDEYVNKIDLPRTERMSLYTDYCSEKQRLYDIYRFAPNAEKNRALRDWISYKLPDELKDGINKDYIYTKNVMVYN